MYILLCSIASYFILSFSVLYYYRLSHFFIFLIFFSSIYYKAGLLPPIVNAGMLIAYSIAYAPKATKDTFYEMGNYAILFYFSHVVTIIIVANLVFWLKDIDPRFRDGEDASFDDIPSLVEHKRKLEESGQNAELQKAAFFVNHIKGDVKDFALDVKDRASGLVNIVTGGLIGQHRERGSVGRDGLSSRRNRTQSASSNYSHENDNDNENNNNNNNSNSNNNSRRNSVDEPIQRGSNLSSPMYPVNNNNNIGSPGNHDLRNNMKNDNSTNVHSHVLLGVIDEEGEDDNTVHNPVHSSISKNNSSDHYV